MKKFKHFLPMILWMVVIFIYSAEPGEKSNGNNFFIIDFLESIGINITAHFGSDLANFLIRKAAHVSEFLILFFLMYFGLYKNRIRQGILKAALFSIFYAATDEVHQLFVLGRDGRVKDVFIDSIGIIIGVLIILIVKKVKHKRNDVVEYVRFI